MKSYTNLEQSKKLAEILPIESADMHYVRKIYDFMGNPVDGKWSHPKYGNPNSKYASYIVQNFPSYEKIPCWSLAALLELIPTDYTPVLTRGTDYPVETNDWIAYIDDCDKLPFKESSFVADNPIDACYEMILKLHELKIL